MAHQHDRTQGCQEHRYSDIAQYSRAISTSLQCLAKLSGMSIVHVLELYVTKRPLGGSSENDCDQVLGDLDTNLTSFLLTTTTA